MQQHSHEAAAACKAASPAAWKTAYSQAAATSAWQAAARSSMACSAAAGNTDAGAMSSFFSMLGQMMQQGQAGQETPTGAALGIDVLSYHPPGA